MVSATYQSEDPNEPPVFYHYVVGTLTETSHNVFAGTFTEERPENKVITKENFTGARLNMAHDYR